MSRQHAYSERVNLARAPDQHATTRCTVPVPRGLPGTAYHELELIPAEDTVAMEATTIRQLHRDLNQLMEQNQLLQHRVLQLERDQRSSTNTSTVEGRLPTRGGVLALRDAEIPSLMKARKGSGGTSFGASRVQPRGTGATAGSSELHDLLQMEN